MIVASSNPFGPDNYADQVVASRRSADVVAEVIAGLLSPSSVLDVGCGAGAWLAAFRELGIQNIQGLEGGHPTADQLQVPADLIRQVDLEVPFDLSMRYDLIVSVEVAEHLPTASADGFVASLVRHSDAVLFSAAIPGQGGAWHINEQWPAYWSHRFAEHGYGCFDFLRQPLWDDNRVEWWYRQNLVVYAAREAADALSNAGFPQVSEPLRLVHPSLYEQAQRELQRPPTIRQSLHDLAGGVRRRVPRRRV